MMGVMILTFLFFFCFVVNVGMLVNAKINLQNAADLAAFSGAATQGRQLTQISYLNYEMRRQYKKFLFRYYVIGNVAQRNFPRTPSGANGHTPYNCMPEPTTAPANNYLVPVVCVIWQKNDNYCQINRLPKISIPNSSGIDSIQTVLIQQLTTLENIREDNCQNISQTNKVLLQDWLWNTDPQLTELINAPGTNATVVSALKVAKALGLGLGLITRDMLLYQRIGTLAIYLNQPGKTLTLETANTLRTAPDPWAAERSVNAFYSAYYTLGNNTFHDPTTITMTELIPPAANPMVIIDPVTTQFDVYAATFQLLGPPPGDCQPVLVPMTPKEPFVVGVSKRANPLTYYAVRLQATASLMFSPWGDMQLTAYSAARPFGSRIGYPFAADAWRWTGQFANPQFLPGNNTQGLVGAVPNLAIQPDDAALPNTSPGPTIGWPTKEVLGTMLQDAFPAIFNGTAAITGAEVSNALQIGMAPNPVESGYYNMLNDLPTSPTGIEGVVDTQHFRQSFDSNHTVQLWAASGLPPARPIRPRPSRRY